MKYGEGKKMQKFLSGLVLGLLVFGIAVHVGRGQQVATMQMKTAQIRQGDLVHMDVSVDKAPNFAGTIFVYLAADGASDITAACGLGAGSRTCLASATIPIDAKTATWTIKKVTFKLNASATEQEIKSSGETTFQVIPRGEIVMPDGATISDIK